MELSNFVEVLDEINLPVQYHSFKIGQAPNPPYLVYLTDGGLDVYADNQRLYHADKVQVELVTDKKELALESKLENLLNEQKLFFEIVDENYIEQEELYVRTYLVTLQ